MKVYVAGKFGRKDEVREVQRLLIEKGHHITSDWTQHPPIQPYSENQDKAREFADEDIDGVMGAEVFIMLADPEKTTGINTELGAAISSFRLTGNPKIYLVGESLSLFAYHPAVNKRNSVEEVVKEIENGK